MKCSNVVIDLAHPVACNFSKGVNTSDGRLVVNTSEGAPPNAGYFPVRYEFVVNAAGPYRLVVSCAPPWTARSSRYSMALDNGRELPVLRRQIVGCPTEHEQRIVRLAEGRHTLELRFRPEEQRLNVRWGWR